MTYPYTSGQVVTAADMNAVGLHLITPTSVTGGTLSGATVNIGTAVTSITVDGVFSSDFDNYRIMWWLYSAGANMNTFIQLRTTSTASTSYYSALNGHRFNDTHVDDFTSNSSSGLIGAVGLGRGGSHHIDVFAPNKTSDTFYQGQNVYANTTYGWTATCSGMQVNTTAYTGFVVQGDGTNTLTGGTIRVYGYSNG